MKKEVSQLILKKNLSSFFFWPVNYLTWCWSPSEHLSTFIRDLASCSSNKLWYPVQCDIENGVNSDDLVTRYWTNHSILLGDFFFYSIVLHPPLISAVLWCLSHSYPGCGIQHPISFTGNAKKLRGCNEEGQRWKGMGRSCVCLGIQGNIWVSFTLLWFLVLLLHLKTCFTTTMFLAATCWWENYSNDQSLNNF